MNTRTYFVPATGATVTVTDGPFGRSAWVVSADGRQGPIGYISEAAGIATCGWIPAA